VSTRPTCFYTNTGRSLWNNIYGSGSNLLKSVSNPAVFKKGFIHIEKSPAEKSYAEKSPAASDGRGFFSVCDSRFFYTTGILYIL
jgi:hypothetical protein